MKRSVRVAVLLSLVGLIGCDPNPGGPAMPVPTGETVAPTVETKAKKTRNKRTLDSRAQAASSAAD